MAGAFTDIILTGSGTGTAVTFGNNSANTFSDNINIILDADNSSVTIANATSFSDCTLTAAADTVLINGTLSTINADITLRANVMNIQAAVSARSGIVTLIPMSAGRFIDLGSPADTAANTLELSDAEIDWITVGVLRIGSTDAGSISFTNTISPAETDTLSLITGDRIVDANNTQSVVQVINLALQTVHGIGDNGSIILDTDVGTIAARNTGTGGISILEVGLNTSVTGKDLNVGTVDGVIARHLPASRRFSAFSWRLPTAP